MIEMLALGSVSVAPNAWPFSMVRAQTRLTIDPTLAFRLLIVLPRLSLAWRFPSSRRIPCSRFGDSSTTRRNTCHRLSQFTGGVSGTPRHFCPPPGSGGKASGAGFSRTRPEFGCTMLWRRDWSGVYLMAHLSSPFTGLFVLQARRSECRCLPAQMYL